MTASTNQRLKTQADVIIVGAGPVGLLTALRLGQAGIDTLVIEKHHVLLKAARAVVYMPVVIPALQQLGILDKIERYAYLNRDGVVWRDVEGVPLAQLPLADSDPGEFGGVMQLGQGRLGELILEELSQYPSVQVRFGLEITDIEDNASSRTVQLTVQNRKNSDSLDIHLQSRYILGTDGANSKVRSLLGIDYPGFTYDDFTMIGTDIVYDFAHHENFSPLNFTVHPDMWAVIVFTAQDEDGHPLDMNVGNSRPQWRIAYGEHSSLPQSKEAIWQRAEERMKVYCRTAPESCKLLRAEPYTMHQRHATQARKGRVMLAGDALHSNNPIGGLGLTGGILDAFCYGNALIRVLCSDPDVSDDSLLTECADARLSTWKSTTDKLSQMNLARLHATDVDSQNARKNFFAKLNGDVDEKERFAGMVRKGLDGMMQMDFLEGVDVIIQRKQKMKLEQGVRS